MILFLVSFSIMCYHPVNPELSRWHPNHSHNPLLSKSLTQPYRKNIQNGHSTLWHLNGLLNPPTGAIDMFWQSNFYGLIRVPPLTVKCPKSPEIRHFLQPYVSFLDINTTVSTWHEEMKLLNHTCAGSREHVHWWLPVRKNASRNISTICLFVRNMSTDFGHLPVIGNMSKSWKLFD